MARAAILFSLLILSLTYQVSADVAVDVTADGGAEVEVVVDVKAEDFNKTEVCVLEEDVGPCKEAHQRFFYNSTTHTCEEFTFGGCQGNKNNFESQKDCMDKCHPEEEEEHSHGADAAGLPVDPHAGGQPDAAAPPPPAHDADAAPGGVEVQAHDGDTAVVVKTGGADSTSIIINTPSSSTEVDTQA